MIVSIVVEKKVRVFEAEQILMATGRRPNTADLHLENTDVKIRQNDGAIIANSEMHTSANVLLNG
jgi:pyruvate/2-oxoglutarate dehydrogenase complex dihydrolipoamide dehydrogenase (E3) component